MDSAGQLFGGFIKLCLWALITFVLIIITQNNENKLRPEWQRQLNKRIISWWCSAYVLSCREVLDSLACVQNQWSEIFMHSSEWRGMNQKVLVDPKFSDIHYVKHERYFKMEFVSSPSLNDNGHDIHQWFPCIPWQAEISRGLLSTETFLGSLDTPHLCSQ